MINFNHVYSSNANKNPDIIITSHGDHFLIDAVTNYKGGPCHLSNITVNGSAEIALPETGRMFEFRSTQLGSHLVLGSGYHNIILDDTTVGGDVIFNDRVQGVVILRNGASIAGRVINGIQVIETNPVTVGHVIDDIQVADADPAIETNSTCVQCVVQ